MAETTAAAEAATTTLPAHIRRDDAVDQADTMTQPQSPAPPAPAPAPAAVEVEYLSAGANRQTAVADWGEDGIVAFGADSNVALWRPRDHTNKGVAALLSGHTGAVKAVKFLPRAVGDEEGTSYLLTGSDDKALRIWSVRSTGDFNKTTTTTAKCIQTTQSHTAPVNCIATLKENNTTAASSSDSKRIFATGAADATIKIWIFDGAESRVVQTIKPTPKFFPLALALSRLGGGSSGDANSPLILAAAGTRDTIQLLVAESSVAERLEFRHQATLSGHEGWIRSLDFVREPQDDNDSDGDLLLASASQDKYIRLWRFHRGAELPPQVRSEGNDPSLGAYLPGRSPSNKAHRLSAAGEEYNVTFEALLLGHDDWIYSAKWFVRRRRSAPAARLQLLSTSADNTLTIWEADPASGIWLSSVRLGEISREKGATTATGSTGGFWTGLWSADGNSVTCLGRTGSWRVWNYSGSSTDGADGDDDDDGNGQWLPQVGISGHTRPVTGIAWAKNGDYLLSTSLDQTTRLHAAWKRKDNNNDDDNEQQRRRETWHEMSRPQIHGYDLNCIDTLGATSFVSGADEKLMRVFTEPRAVANLLEGLGGIVVVPDANSNNYNSSGGFLPDAANMPVLGLSNKAIEAVDDDDAELDNQLSADPHNAADRDALDPAMAVRKSHLASAPTRPPLEDTLSRHTLWPEAEKLYGHGYELSCLSASHDGRLVASACRASSFNHAVIRLFETERWTEVRPPLAAHTLTATRLRWSADDRYLLSVGRDRAWAVFERVDGSGAAADADAQQEGAPLAAEGQFRLKQTNPKGHTRMILDAAWAPPSPPGGSETGQQRLVFATAGRDKQVKLWHQAPPPLPSSSQPSDATLSASEAEATSGSGSSNSSSEIILAGSISETHPVTAIDFLPYHHYPQGTSTSTSHPSFVLAVGTEIGNITVHRIDCATLGVVSSMEIPGHLCLAKAVLQLSWRPPRDRETTKEEAGGSGDTRSELAVAGDDGSLRIYSFR